VARFRGRKLGAANFLEDFAVLKAICDEVLAPLDHQYLNDLPAFAGGNPTAEALAVHLYHELARLTAGHAATVLEVTVYESDTASVTYRED
jgi:6-pyruvoyltetrahydropterin/6-carboxytetrahydropterin synthase